MSILALTTRKRVSKTLLKKVDGIVAHVANVAEPTKIYLIGSVLSGWIHRDSDVDLVAVFAKPFDRQKMALKIHPGRPHKDVALDLHCVTAEEFARTKDIGGICFEASHCGKVVFAQGKSL